MRIWKSKVLSFALAFAVLATPVSSNQVLAADQPAPLAEAKVFQYVAFGDSLTVGYEPGVSLTNPPYGFVERVYEQALMGSRAEYHNFGIAGLTSTGLKNFLSAVVAEKAVTGAEVQPNLPDPRADQVVANTKATKAAIQQANLITITIGGNDFWAFNEVIKGKSEAEVAQLVEQRMTTYTANMTEILKMIFTLNPSVKVVVADQYNPMPNINQLEYDTLLKLGVVFTDTLEGIAQGFQGQQLNVRVVQVADDFIGRELAYTHVMERDIHPNQLGYGVMAEQFADVVWGDYHVAKRQDPITIVVGGKQVETYQPLLLQDSTFVPIREYAESLGAVVEWEQATLTAIVTIGDKVVRLTKDSDIAYVGDIPVKLSGKVQMSGAKIYVPLRVLAEGLGYDVKYVQQSHTVYVNQ